MQTPGALGLRVDGEIDRHVRVGGAVHVEDADAVVVFDDGHPGVCDDGFDERLAAARHEQIDVFVHLREVAHGVAVGARDEQDAVGGQSGGGRAVAQGVGDGEVGMDRLAASAQDGGVARFRAKDGGVAGDVGTGFVDDAHDADGHAAFRYLNAVGAGPGAEGFADGIGQRGDGADALGHASEAWGVEAEAVEHRAGEAVLLRGVGVAGVGGEDRGRVAVKGVGHGEEAAILLIRSQTGKRTGCSPGALAEGEHFVGEVHVLEIIEEA